MATITGFIEKIKFRNEENGYTPEKHRPEKIPFLYVRGENRIKRQLGYPRSARGGSERRGVVYENAQYERVPERDFGMPQSSYHEERYAVVCEKFYYSRKGY